MELAIFGDTRGLLERFGRDRIRNTPICEPTLTGMAVGAAAAGYRVVLHMMFSNFLYTGFDAIANQMAKLRLMTGGQLELPITIMAGYGGGRSNAAQHSDTPHPLLMNLGGVNVAVPSSPADAKGLLKTAIRGRNPTFFMEASGRGGDSGEVPDGEHLVPFGKANIAREGTDITLITIGTMVKPTLAAAKQLESAGISAEVLDPRTLVPLDEKALLRSVRKTGRAVVDRRSARSLQRCEPHRRGARRQGVLRAQGAGEARDRARRRDALCPERRSECVPERRAHRRRGACAHGGGRVIVGSRGMKMTLKLARVGMNMAEATIAKWHKQPGESFKTGDVLYEIETDKVTQEVTAPSDGTLLEILVPAGEIAEVGAAVCSVDAKL